MMPVSGWDIMQNLAQRYQALFPSLLPSTYSRSDYYFRVSDRQRSVASLRAFADGLFGPNGYMDVEFEEAPGQDTLLHVRLQLATSPVKLIKGFFF